MRNVIILLICILLFFNCSKLATTYNTGLQHHKKDRTDEAKTYYHEAIDLNPEDPDLNNNLGCIYLEEGDYERARQFLENAVMYNPNSAKFRFNLGVLYQTIENNQGAVQEFSKVLDLNPRDYECVYRLGNIYLDTEDYANAINSFNDCIEICNSLNVYFPDAYFNLGLAQESNNLEAAAINTYEQYIEMVTDQAEKDRVATIITDIKTPQLQIVYTDFRHPSGDNTLYPNEKAYYTMSIQNHKKYPGNFQVEVEPGKEYSGLTVTKSNSYEINSLEIKDIELTLETTDAIIDGNCKLQVKLFEPNFQKIHDQKELSFNTVSALRPEFEIELKEMSDDSTFNENNNNNGEIEKEEKIKIVLEVKNVGKGTGEGVRVRINFGNISGLFFSRFEEEGEEKDYDLEDMEPGDTKEIVFMLQTDDTYVYPSINFFLNLRDSNNIVNVSKDFSMAIKNR